ncbi:uncharacterized protein [Gossypium hirsutum]|uniref:RNase H type-1 domain-containing protein n=1 Tax=Gossypium hirsutum TaxID=3635 RepID=A0A1U8IBH3_GOSHI|nr:uncharacterized protein LOC107892569 [Gossypium hirsutum]
MVKELWRPPNPGIIKLNFDASFQGDSKTSTAAVLARNNEGKIMGACTYPYEGVVDAFVTEARAYERALLFEIDLGFRSILLEGDSLSIIKKLKLDSEDRSVLRPISQSIQLLEGHIVEVTYHFVPKEANRVAHNLALEGRRCQTSCFWVEEALNSVEKVVDEN